MKKLILLTILMILISINSFAKYSPQQLVTLQDMSSGGGSILEDNGKFAWITETENYFTEIFYFDGFKTYQITNDDHDGTKNLIDFRNREILYQDVWYDYDNGGNQVVDLYLYKYSNVINLSNDNRYNGFVNRYDDRICWISGPYAGSANNEVYLYENGTINRITNNDYCELGSLLNKDYLVWVAKGNSDVEDRFFIYKDGNITEFPINILLYQFFLSDKGIVFQGCDDGEHCSEVNPPDLDHEIFFYDFNNIIQITDTPDRNERDFHISNDIIVVSNGSIDIFDYNGEKKLEVQNATMAYPEVKNSKYLFRGNLGELYLFDGNNLQTLDSEHDFWDVGFTLGGVGCAYQENGNIFTYFYKDGKKELIFDAFSSYAGFYENYITYTYRYSETGIYKLVYLDPNLPYIQLSGNEAHRLWKGDTLEMSLTVKNPGPDQAVDIYIFEISGELPFGMIRCLTPEGFKGEFYGYKNVMLPKDLDLTFEFYSAKIGDIPDAPLSKVSYMVIPTHAGTFIPLTAFPSTLSYELVK
jgi:hypothetical protein